MNEEIWKDIKGYEGLYVVSNIGNVKSMPHKKRSRFGSFYVSKERSLKKSNTKYGYLRVTLYKGKSRKSFFVHRLVLENFSNELPKEAINHINEIKRDNRLENLEYMTRAENNRHGTRGERISKSSKGVATKRQKQKVMLSNKDGSFKVVYESLSEAHKRTKINRTSITRACQRKNGKAGGYYWQYV